MNSPSLKNKMVRALTLFFFFVSPAFLTCRTASAQEAFAPPAFRLIGTIESKDFTGAVLIDAAGKQTVYRLHETAPDGSQIVSIAKGGIVLKRPDGTRYELYIIHDMAAAPPSGAPYTSPVAAPPAAEVRQLPFVPGLRQSPGGPGPGDEAKERHPHHFPPGMDNAEQGEGAGQQNPGPGPNSGPASEPGRPQHGQPRPHGWPQK